MKCPYCDRNLAEGAAICGNCGAVIAAADPAEQALQGSVGADASAAYADMGFYGEEDVYPPMDYIPVEVPRAPAAQQGRKGRKKPHIALRIPLQILSLLLSVVLFVSVLCAALLMDLNRMLSAGGIKQLVDALFSVSQSSAPNVSVGAVGANVVWEEQTPEAGETLPAESTVPGDVQIPTDVEIPSDVLTGGDSGAIAQWLTSVIREVAGEDVVVDEKQVQEFVEQSTLTDYMAEKAAGYAEDFINGTQNTQITSEELLKLVEENEELIASTFQVELTPEVKAELEVALEQTIVENDLNRVIHEEVIGTMQEEISNALPVDWATIQAALQALTSDTVLFAAIGVCLVLMLLLCALNFYNIPGGMAWSAVSCIGAGAILSLPLVLLQAAPNLLTELTFMPEAYVQLLQSFSVVFGMVHYGVLFIGLALLVLSIVLAIIRATRQHKQAAAF